MFKSLLNLKYLHTIKELTSTLILIILIIPQNGIAQSLEILVENRIELSVTLKKLDSYSSNNNIQASELESQLEKIRYLFNVRDTMIKASTQELSLLQNHINSDSTSNYSNTSELLIEEFAKLVKHRSQDIDNGDTYQTTHSSVDNNLIHYQAYINNKIDNYYSELIKTTEAKSSQQHPLKHETMVAVLNSEKLASDTLEQFFLTIVDNIENKKTDRPSNKSLAEDKQKKRFRIIQRTVADLNKQNSLSENSMIFENRQGFHKWPVNNGQIQRRFGFQDSKGLDIISKDDNIVKVICEGKVVKKVNLSDEDIIVFVDHGMSYFSVYSNLKYANVREGDYLNDQEVIGLIAADEDDNYFIHFEVWHINKNLNPAQWLKNI